MILPKTGVRFSGSCSGSPRSRLPQSRDRWEEVLPVVTGPAPLAAPGDDVSRRRAAAALIETRMSRILLIEDDLRLAEMVKNYLSEAGFSVTAAHTGAAGIALHGARDVRRAGARPDAAGHRRPRRLPAHPRRRADADPDADRARRRHGPGGRPGDGRRRLSAQAVRAARTAGAAARHPAPRQGRARKPRSCASAASRSIVGARQVKLDGEERAAHRLSVRTAAGAGPARRPGDVARRADGPGQARAAGGVRPLDRRAHLAHPRGDRGRSPRSRAASSPCAAPATSSPRRRTRARDAPPLSEDLSRLHRQPRWRCW